MIKWIITQMEAVQASGMVFVVNWLVYAVDEEANVITGYVGSIDLSTGSEDFIPYNDLTEEVVLGWVWQTIDKSDIEQKMAGTLQDKIDGTTVSGLPWKEYPTH